ncbi:polyprenyl synthetase family protein [Planococcus lenghuensis]|uniref:Farnesyl diphosphate synthase n=1 Tax=Planococcus lenghuensis TaxID=2213202 RepID=A0A1Q2KY24_9BACL|nr:farnesyl diphosphate synthase [Planococcus lenghuensis]AQQ53026.1 farnesyl-diphosphate synthase [Planococcus lenghuensis]
MKLTEFRQQKEIAVQEELGRQIQALAIPAVLKESMNYSLQAGGKRIRPILLLAVLEEKGVQHPDALKVACAIEMIHTYSLIHDDLPSMDNDDLRRGQPTNHKVYGEAAAILAGDALLTYSFGLIARLETVPAEDRLRLIDLLSTAAGAEGMVGGQVLDMEGEERKLSLEELEQVHQMKTGALLTYSIVAGAVLAGCPPGEIPVYAAFGRHLGLAFQIQDDILDVTGSSAELGKTAGKDAASDKSTYPGLLTLPKAQEKLVHHAEAAKTALQKLPGDHLLLEQLTDLIVHRTS